MKEPKETKGVEKDRSEPRGGPTEQSTETGRRTSTRVVRGDEIAQDLGVGNGSKSPRGGPGKGSA